MSDSEPGYILVDLDRTLAYYASWEKQGQGIGEPVPAMLERVQRWIHTGTEVRIFTARAYEPNLIPAVEAWCEKHIGRKLKVQNWKCFRCIGIWDDLAVTVEANTGWRNTCFVDKKDPLSKDEERKLTEFAYQRTKTKER